LETIILPHISEGLNKSADLFRPSEIDSVKVNLTKSGQTDQSVVETELEAEFEGTISAKPNSIPVPRVNDGGFISADTIQSETPRLRLLHPLDHAIREHDFHAGRFCLMVDNEAEYEFATAPQIVFVEIDCGYEEYTPAPNQLPKTAKTLTEVHSLGGEIGWQAQYRWCEVGDSLVYVIPSGKEMALLLKNRVPSVMINGGQHWFPASYEVKKTAFGAVVGKLNTYYRLYQRPKGLKVFNGIWQLGVSDRTNPGSGVEYMIPTVTFVRDAAAEEIKQLGL
jgi:hypothetical protein